jgi:hypothetical protein
MSYQFQYTCPKCGNLGYGKPVDQYIKATKDIRVLRVNPNHMEIEHNPVTGRTIYSMRVPPVVANSITVGRKDTLQTIPQVFITAVATGKRVVFKPNTLFHLKRTSISRNDAGWGLPLITPVMKSAFFYRILLKAQEQVALGHILPLRIFFPQTADPKGDPYTTYNLIDWQEHIKAELGVWREDQNYMPVMPYPVGSQIIGGQGKMLLLHNEIKAIQEQILAGLGVPSELVFGGMKWQASSISMRTLENTFLRMREDIQHLIKFVIRGISSGLGLPICKVQQKPFRMADDLQKAAYDLQLVDRKFLSPETLMEGRDFDFDAEQKRIYDSLDTLRKLGEKQATDGAEINGEAGLIAAKYQAEQQKVMQENMPPPPGPVGPDGQPLPVGPDGQPIQKPAEPGQWQPQPGQQGLPQEQMEQLGASPTDVAMPPGAPQAPGANPAGSPEETIVAEQAARSLFGLEPTDRPKALIRLRDTMPRLYPLVLEELNRMNVSKFSGPPK